MKFEIDLNEILGDEERQETMQDSIRRQVVEQLTKEVAKGIKNKINEEVTTVINDTLKSAIQEQLPGLMNDLLNAEYEPVSTYGQKQPKTTLKEQLVKVVQDNMVYKKQGSYRNDNNAFTNAVDSVLEELVRKMKYDFDKQICDLYTKEAFAYATTKMAEKLGIPLVKADLVKP